MSSVSFLPDNIRTNTVPTSPLSKINIDDDNIKDTIVVNIGLFDEKSLFQFNAIIQQYLDPSPGNSKAVLDENILISADGIIVREKIGLSQL